MSSVPDVMDELLVVLPAWPDLSGWQFVDGPPVVELENDVIAVGFNLTGDAIEFRQNPSGMSGDRESYDIHGIASAYTGNEDEMSETRRRAFEAVKAIRAALKENLTVNGKAVRAKVTTGNYEPSQTTDGLVVDVRFTLSVDAFLR